MSEPIDAAKRAWQSEASPQDAGKWRARIEHLQTEQRQRTLRFWLSAAIIVPGWMAAFWFFPDLRPLAAISLGVGAWLMANAYRRLPRTTRSPGSELPGAAFEMQRLSRERDFHRAFPQRLLPAIAVGQVAIVWTLLTNPRFEKNLVFPWALAAFVLTVIVALSVIYRRSRTIASELDHELRLLAKGVE